jgi:hypothetical protein
VHVLVFNPETDAEALYTTSRRDGDFAANDFVAFESLQDATRASVRVSDQVGEMPVVDAVDPRVVVFLADQCGYGVDVVPAGAPFEPPGVLIDETPSGDRDDPDADPETLAISTVDLKKYLANGGDLTPPTPRGEEEDEREVETTQKTRVARARAASAMRIALTAPIRRVRGAVRDVTRAPARSMLTPMRAVQRSVRRAARVPETRELEVYRALIGLAGKRVKEME